MKMYRNLEKTNKMSTEELSILHKIRNFDKRRIDGTLPLCYYDKNWKKANYG